MESLSPPTAPGFEFPYEFVCGGCKAALLAEKDDVQALSSLGGSFYGVTCPHCSRPKYFFDLPYPPDYSLPAFLVFLACLLAFFWYTF